MIEVLLVLAIIGVLISLLLPAIQSSREQVRRVSCQNNLLQLGTALFNYSSSHRVLPPGVVNDRGPVTVRPGGYRFGWAVQILPYLDQSAMYREFNFGSGVDSPANSTARQHRIQTFLCPSSGAPGSMTYAACHHDVEAPIDADNHGVFYLNSRTRLEDITDGPAFTIFVGEMASSSIPDGWAVGDRATLRNTGGPINGGLIRPFPAGFTVQSFENFDEKAAGEAALANPIVGGFLSVHPGGANFLFGDGSVRFLNVGIDAAVYRRLGHRADGEMIDGEDF